MGGYVGHPDWVEWVGVDRVRSKALKGAPQVSKEATRDASGTAKSQGSYDLSGLTKGLRVQAFSEGVWYAAEIVSVSNSAKRAKAPIKVGWLGKADDSWVGVDAVRSKALKDSSKTKTAKSMPTDKAKAPKSTPTKQKETGSGKRV